MKTCDFFINLSIFRKIDWHLPLAAILDILATKNISVANITRTYQYGNSLWQLLASLAPVLVIQINSSLLKTLSFRGF